MPNIPELHFAYLDGLPKLNDAAIDIFEISVDGGIDVAILTLQEGLLNSLVVFTAFANVGIELFQCLLMLTHDVLRSCELLAWPPAALSAPRENHADCITASTSLQGL